MAWRTGPHADAPQGVLCYAGEEPGTVTWFEEDAPPGRAETPPAPPSEAPHRAGHKGG